MTDDRPPVTNHQSPQFAQYFSPLRNSVSTDSDTVPVTAAPRPECFDRLSTITVPRAAGPTRTLPSLLPSLEGITLSPPGSARTPAHARDMSRFLKVPENAANRCQRK